MAEVKTPEKLIALFPVVATAGITLRLFGDPKKLPKDVKIMEAPEPVWKKAPKLQELI